MYQHIDLGLELLFILTYLFSSSGVVLPNLRKCILIQFSWRPQREFSFNNIEIYMSIGTIEALLSLFSTLQTTHKDAHRSASQALFGFHR